MHDTQRPTIAHEFAVEFQVRPRHSATATARLDPLSGSVELAVTALLAALLVRRPGAAAARGGALHLATRRALREVAAACRVDVGRISARGDRNRALGAPLGERRTWWARRKLRTLHHAVATVATNPPIRAPGRVAVRREVGHFVPLARARASRARPAGQLMTTWLLALCDGAFASYRSRGVRELARREEVRSVSRRFLARA